MRTAPSLLVLEAFATLEDPRQRGKVCHPLSTILLIVVGAVLCGMTEWDAMAAWAVDHADWIAARAPGGRGTPSADTLRRVFARLQPAAFERCLTAWTRSLARSLAGQHLAVDGKSVAGAVDPAQPTVPLHRLHVWASSRRLVLAARPIAGAPAEPRALVAVLALLDVRGAVLTGDANLATAATTAAIVDGASPGAAGGGGGGGDYVFGLKGNRGPQFAEAVAWFDQTAAGGAPDAVVDRASSGRERGHGRVERRTAVAAPIAYFPRCAALFAGAQAVVRVERTRRTRRGASHERAYFVASLPPDAGALLEWVRRHWAIENVFHGALDVVLHEDACRRPKDHAATNLAFVRRLALGQLQRDTTVRRSLVNKQRKADRDDAYRDHLLSLGSTD